MMIVRRVPVIVRGRGRVALMRVLRARRMLRTAAVPVSAWQDESNLPIIVGDQRRQRLIVMGRMGVLCRARRRGGDRFCFRRGLEHLIKLDTAQGHFAGGICRLLLAWAPTLFAHRTFLLHVVPFMLPMPLGTVSLHASADLPRVDAVLLEEPHYRRLVKKTFDQLAPASTLVATWRRCRGQVTAWPQAGVDRRGAGLLPLERVTASVGIATGKGQSLNAGVSRLLAVADGALYRAKAQGRNRVAEGAFDEAERDRRVS